MHKPESVMENEKQEIHWDFEILTDQLIPTRRPDLVLLNKTKQNKKRKKTTTCRRVDLATSVDYIVKITKTEKRHKYSELVREL